jgi:uncharacterized DUF497 family protein
MDEYRIRLPRFAFDDRKSRINKLKHGIDFVEAQALWLDASLTESEARSDREPRALMVGRIDGRHWSAFVTYRAGAVRIISVRRSRREEVVIYEGQ